MREQLINIFSKIIEGGVILLAFSLPLFFLPITTNAFEFPKQLLLFFFVSVLTLVWVAKMILERKVQILHSPLTLPILIFLGLFFISAIFSVSRFSSIFGSYPRLHGGLVSLISYILTFFLVASNIRDKKQISRIFITISLSGFLLVIVGLLNFFDLSPLGNFLRGRFLTLAGSADRTSLFLAILLPIPLFTFFFEKRKILLIFSGVLSFLFIFYIFLISTFAALLSVFLIFFIALLFSQLKLSRKTALRIGIFFFFSLFLLTINNWDFIRSKTPFLKNYPIQHDITLEQNTAWAITTGAFQNLKLLSLGSGPGTYIFEFTSFKPVRFNQTTLWNLRFEKSSNEYFHITSTLGILGLLSFIYILISALKLGRESLRESQLEEKETLEKGSRRSNSTQSSLERSLAEVQEERPMKVTIFSTLLIFILISFFAASFTLTAWLFWLFLALMIAGLRSFARIRETEPSLAIIQSRGLGVRPSSAEAPEVKGEILPWLVGFIAILILVPLLWQEINIFRAELYFTKAQVELLQEKPDANFILSSLRGARDTMPSNDTYRRSLSATSLNFAILGEQQKLLNEEVKQQLLQTAVREGEWAVRLASYNIFNWENLQRVYSLITLENQDDLLINNVFPQEIFLDPANPRHRNDLGWAYFNLRNDTELAKRNFQDAISLKPDFPDAHYNLARVYKEEGKEERALKEYDQTLNFLNQQIVSLEGVVSQRADLQKAFNQLIQFKEQVEGEKREIQQGEIEQEEVERKEVQPEFEEEE